jgi:hypothetical protein
MPDDAVFEGSPKPNGGAEKTAEPAGATQTPVGLTPEQVEAKLEEKLSPIEKSLSEMNNFFAKLQEQAAAGTQATAEPAEGEDWATRFYNEPQGTVKSEIQSEVAPVLQQAAGTMGKMLLDQHHTAIDAEFGEGAWDEVFEGRLAPIVREAAQTNPTSLMSETAVRNAVNSIKGDNFAVLAARAAKLAEKPSEDPNEAIIAAAAERAVEMTGGIRRIPSSKEEKLDDEESQEFLKTFFRQTGEEPDPGKLAKLMSAGNYIGDWEKATKKENE